MTTKTLTRFVLAGIGAAALAVAMLPPPASADPAAASSAVPASSSAPRTLAGVKAAVDVRIDLRLKTIAALKIAVSGATDLTSSDKSTLAGLLASDDSGLTALKTKTDAETTIAGVKADGASMVDDYRVYMLVTPKVRFAIASDRETDVIGKLTTVQQKLAALATQLAGQGKDTSAAQAKITDMQTRLAAATAALSGKVATLLTVQPSSDPNAMKAAVAPVRTAVQAARADIKAALADAKAARDDLKALGS